MAYATEKMIALAAVREASVLCEQVKGALTPETLEKKDRSPVTVADFGSQALVCSRLRRAFPDDRIIAEETSATLRTDVGRSTLDKVVRYVRDLRPDASTDDVLSWIDFGDCKEFTDRHWTLDPIDGTKGFLRGDQYVVALALIEKGEVVVGAVACPNLLLPGLEAGRGVVAIAAKDEGTDFYRLQDMEHAGTGTVSQTTEPAHMRFCESVESGHTSHENAQRIAEIVGISGDSVRMDSQAKYVAVAAGAAEIYMRLPSLRRYVENIWDHAAGMLLVEEAGGRVSDINGRPLDFHHGFQLAENRGVIVSNGPVHDALLAAIKEIGLT